MIKELLVKYFEAPIKNNWNELALSDYENGSLKYSDVGKTILSLHQLFKEHKIKEGDKVALIGKNCGNWACVYLATVSYGAVIVPLLQEFPNNDIYNLTNHSESKLLFASDFIFAKLETDKFEHLNSIYALEDYSIKHNYLSDDIEFNRFDDSFSSEQFSLPEHSNEKLAAILYTSGTAGQPKGVMLNHNTLAANIRYARANMPLVKGDRIVSFLPLAHCYGCAFEFLYPFSLGCSITFLGRLPSPNIVVKVFNEIKPKLILSVPLVLEKVYKNKIKPVLNKPTVKFMIKLPLIRNIIYSKVRKSLNESFGNSFIEVVIGGAKLNREVEVFLRKIKFRFSIGYGMTECGPLITYDGWKTTKIFSAGKVVDTLEMTIDSSDPENKVGEILLRGENIMNGYYKNKEETDKVFNEDGWMRTGDLGLIDKDGYLFIKGRSKSMILNSSGKNIYPEEIESKFLNLPLVGECVVVGRKNQIIALVYPDQERLERQNLDKEHVEMVMVNYQKLVNKNLPQHMKINKVIIRDEAFEKTPKKSIKRYLYN
jgi:long-chain acyl-CoA synthetase